MLTEDVILRLWESFVDEYIYKCRNWELLVKLYSREKELLEKHNILDTAYGIWGWTWHETDLINQFSYRIYQLIMKKGYALNIHLNYQLKPNNFKLIKNLHKRLTVSVYELRRTFGFGRNWYPEMDMIITNNMLEFKYCFEFKYYHYYPRNWDIIRDLKRKILILKTLKRYGICKKVGILLLDDAICRVDKKLCKTIDEILTNAEKDEVLALKYHVSYEDLYKSLDIYLKLKLNSESQKSNI